MEIMKLLKKQYSQSLFFLMMPSAVPGRREKKLYQLHVAMQHTEEQGGWCLSEEDRTTATAGVLTRAAAQQPRTRYKKKKKKKRE